MKIINPSVELITINPEENIQKHIERIGRTCYKSEENITDDSHKKFISNLYNRKHWAMLEHFIFIAEIKHLSMFYLLKNAQLKYFDFTSHFDTKQERACHIISFSARAILDAINEGIKNPDFDADALEALVAIKKQMILDYECYELLGSTIGEGSEFIHTIYDITEYDDRNQYIHGWNSIKFICDRGVTHEIVRHRPASYAQESTRYCNYSKDKFGNEITVIKPLMFDPDNEEGSVERQKYNFWKEGIEASEKAYIYLLDMGATAQEARSVLPNSLKTELVMTAKNYELCHFLGLRCDKAAHPQMRELAIPLFGLLAEQNGNVFNSDNVVFTE